APGNGGGAGLDDAIVPPTGNLGALAPDAVLPAGTLTRLQSAPLEQVLQIYALVTGRIVLRPNTLPAAQLTLDASQMELTKDEAIQALDSVLSLNGITMIPVGSKFVTAVPTAQALQEAAAFSDVDSEDLPEAGQFVTKIVQLKYAPPSEIMPLVQGFSKIQNGIVPIDSTMTMVIRDNAANVKRMMEIINRVDVEVERDYKLEVIPIKYGTVEEIYATMGSLIGGGAGGGVGGAATTQRTGMQGGTGQRSNTRSNLGSQRSSSSMNRGGFGNPGYGNFQPQQAQMTRVGAPAATAATTSFNQRLQGIASRMGGQQQPVQLLQDARIVPDERSNSLIVFASKEDLQMITNMVAKVDQLLAQVLIEATIMNVSLTGDLEFGVSAFLKDDQGDWQSAGGWNPTSVLTNVVDSRGGGGGIFAGSYKGDVNFLVKALANKGRGQVLATPRIQTSHAKAASFSVGQTVPYTTGQSGAGGVYGSYSSFSQLDVSTTLDVTPFITPDGLVVMEIDQNIEELNGFAKLGEYELPKTIRRTAFATVSVQDGDTILLGGYVRADRDRSSSGVPLLKDIPILGAAFRSTSDQKSRTELVVFLKPTVLPSPRDAAIFASEQRQSLPGIRRMEQDMAEELNKLQEDVDRELDGKKRKKVNK
ncbi:MAG: secretin N-terminal domain-containing protein, partial [Limisphaerales bacterium]